ncbi:MAG: isoprenyl transferase [Candidatus Omnitrophica bacterium]|nr:isoprenyl transferase [Candidatus Omnitrophota bacterium]
MEVPQHIAIIMDGNGRWAKKKGLLRTAGHKRGIEKIKEIVRETKKLGVQALTIFAFSTENWNRPKKEIDFLFRYLDKFLDDYKKELMKEEIRLKVIGRKSKLKKTTVNKIKELENLTENHKSFFFNIAIDYGGRWDIVGATRGIVSDCINKKLTESDIDEKTFGSYLSLGDDPEPDLLIRTSGEQRISNFLLWNLAYSELYFTETFWPDFDHSELKKAVAAYSARERRYGEIHG